MTGRDMYADLEKIEARGKRKKEKEKKDGFSLFGKKRGQEETRPVSEPAPEPERPEAEPIRLVEAKSEPAESEPDDIKPDETAAAQQEETVTIGVTGESQPPPEEPTEPETPPDDKPIVPEKGSEEDDVDISTVIPKLPSDYEAERKKPEEKVPEKPVVISKPPAETREKSLQDSRFYQRDIYAAFDQIEERGKKVKEKKSGFFSRGSKPEKAKSKPAAETPDIRSVEQPDRESEPALEPAAEPEPEPAIELITQPEPAPEPEPVPPPESVQEPVTEPAPEPEPLPPPEPLREPVTEPAPEPEPVPPPEPVQEPVTEPEIMLEPGPEPSPEPENEVVVEPVFTPEPQPAPEPDPQPDVEASQISQPSHEPQPEPSTETESAPRWTPLSGKQLIKADEALTEYKRKLDRGFKSGKLTKEQCVQMVHQKEIELGLRPPDDLS